MDLPSPTFSFSIPSIRDGLRLECRVYLPAELQNIQSASSWQTRGAIVAHPYARLGGCYDDPVVSFIGGELLQAGYLVGTFNFRGAGGSEGQTSWTAKSELEDYVAFYGFMVQYLQELKHGLAGNPSCETTVLSVPGDGDGKNNNNSNTDNIKLILGGYSYGSLIASHAPDIDVILGLFRFNSDTVSPSRPTDEIGRVARKIAAASLRNSHPSNPDETADDSQPRASPSISIAYLLVSPLLPPVSQFLTCFSTLSLNVGGMVAGGTGDRHQAGLVNPNPVEVRPDHQLSTHSSLALFGDQDTFTSAQKLQRWSAEMARVPQSRFQSGEIGGAGHFWREDGVETRARNRLRTWLNEI